MSVWMGDRNVEIIVLEETIKMPHQKQSGRMILSQIEQRIEKTPYFISHLVVDGVVVYDEFESYLDKHMDRIDQIIVETRDIGTFIEEILISEMHYLEGALPELRGLVAELSTSPDENTWMRLGDFFDALQWMFESFEGIDSQQNLSSTIRDYRVWNRYSKEIYIINSQVPELEKAFRRQDFTGLARILDHEMIPALERLLSHILGLVDLER